MQHRMMIEESLIFDHGRYLVRNVLKRFGDHKKFNPINENPELSKPMLIPSFKSWCRITSSATTVKLPVMVNSYSIDCINVTRNEQSPVLDCRDENTDVEFCCHLQKKS